MKNRLLNSLENLRPLIGNTPIVKLSDQKINLYTKLEYHNLMNSIKTRTAYQMLKGGIERGEITKDTTIIESSSGNLAISLGALCNRIGLQFIPVIDPNINSNYESLLYTLTPSVVKVTERDYTGGFLLSRLKKVKELVNSIPNAHWTNQYNNLDNFQAHYHGTGEEIVRKFESLDYVFVGVGTGGTIAGLSNRLKEKFSDVKIIAVDSQGSVIFGDTPKNRYIPGIGSSIVPPLINKALIDDIIHVPEKKTIQGCHELLNQHALFVGGSSGSSYYAIQQYFQDKHFQTKPNVLFLCPDNGQPYTSTIYNSNWINWLHQQHELPI